jgi:hypothetical protein
MEHTAGASLNLAYFFLIIYNLLPHGGGLGSSLVSIWSFLTGVAVFLAFLFIGVIAYATTRLNQTKHAEHHLYETIEPAEAEREVENSRWHHVIALIESTQESDWRQAIIEADIMLDDILAGHGYTGVSVGEKLKQGDPVRFRTLQDAWDAHKVRNDIAHQGSQFQLTDHLAYRTIGKYKNVFEEFHAV